MNPNSKHITILEKLLKLPENKECAECKSKAPRWASINLGIFICLRCSGIHRSLGVHISKVRSTTLDTWLPEQVSFMQSMGNSKSNRYWEAELPLDHDRGQIENFIREKYVEKRWITKDCNKNSSSNSNQEPVSSRSSRSHGGNELTSSRSSRIYGSSELTSQSSRIYGSSELTSRSSRIYGSSGLASRSSRIYGSNQLSSRSSRRYGSIAEWTNSQHLFKERRDSSMGEKDKAGSSPGTGETAVDCTDSKNQHQEKKENCQPSMDRSAHTDSKCINCKPSKEPAQVVCTLGANGRLRRSEQDGSKINPSTANVLPAVHPPKVDYADELFRTLCADDSVDSGSSPYNNEWVRFNSDQESLTPKGKIVSNEIIQEAKLTSRSAATNNDEPKIEDIQTAVVPFTAGNLSEHPKDVTNNKQSFLNKSHTVSSSSVHLQRLGMLAQSVSSTDEPKLPGNVIGSNHQLNMNGRSIERTTSTRMPMQNFQALNSAAYTMSRPPAAPFKGVPIMPPSTRGTHAALPVSGYDYDFSYLTQEMFAKR